MKFGHNSDGMLEAVGWVSDLQVMSPLSSVRHDRTDINIQVVIILNSFKAPIPSGVYFW